MIPLLAAFAFRFEQTIVELPKPDARAISIQAILKVPDLGSKDFAKLQIIARTIPKQTQPFPRREMMMITDGAPVKCQITPDRIRVVVNVAPGKLKAGISLLYALMNEATLTQDNLDASELQVQRVDYWSAALNPVLVPRVKLGAEEAQVLYHKVFQIQLATIAVGGAFRSGEAEALLTAKEAPAPAPKLPQRGVIDRSVLPVRTEGPGAVSTIDLVGPPIVVNDVAIPQKLLALYALGVGKEGSLFRIVRQKHAWSYRQEAILSPTKDGWVPRLVIASIPFTDATRVKTIQSELLEDVSHWDEKTRLRALGMAEAVMLRGVRQDPVYVYGAHPADNSLEDETYLAAYWPVKAGRPWDQASLLESMRKVTLADLKEQAESIVGSAIPRVLQGQG